MKFYTSKKQFFFKFEVFIIVSLALYMIYTNIYFNEKKHKRKRHKINVEKQIINEKIINLNQMVKSNNDKFIEFEINHLKIIRGDLPIQVVWNGYTEAGYANKLYSMLSSLILAILTDSAFFIRWKYIDKFIEEPFYLTFRKFNEKTLLNPEFKKTEIFYAKASPNVWKLHKDMENLIQTSLPNKTRIIYSDYDPYFFEICSNPKFIQKLHEYNLVDIETVKKVNYIKNNWKSVDKDLKTNYLLHVGFEVGGKLLNKLWRPKTNIKNIIQNYVKNIFLNYYVIGIQFRVEFLNDLQDIPTFFECALTLEQKILQENLKFNQRYQG